MNYTAQSVPHIIPGVLQPAVGGNDLSGTALGGSYVYGTAHTDGDLNTTTPISKEVNLSKTLESAHILVVRGTSLNHFKN